MKPIFHIIFLLSLVFWGCGRAVQSPETAALDENPAAPEFNFENSDAQAIALADEVMKASGGRAAWDETRYLRWNFFGRRTLTWDKHQGRVRIEIPADSVLLLVNLQTMEGRARVKGREITDADTLAQWMDRGKSIWINDSYWLVMPFKLKDSGVSLKYLRADTTQTGEAAQVVQLTFEQVGDTPENKYEVYISDESKRVVQWAFFQKSDQETPNFITPWANYRQLGRLWLSGDRGQRQLTDIEVLENLEESTFKDW
jgi:hypothetical protein